MSVIDRWKNLRRLARHVENRWLRYAITLLALSGGAYGSTKGLPQAIVLGVLAFTGLLMTIYFTSIALKFRAGIVAWLGTLALFTVAAYLLWTIPGVSYWRFVLTPFISGWLACGLATGLGRAEALNWTAAPLRLLSILIAWLGIAGLALLPVAIFAAFMIKFFGTDLRETAYLLIWICAPAVLLDFALGIIAGVKGWRRCHQSLNAAAVSE